MFSSRQHFLSLPIVVLFENLLRQVRIPTEQTGFPDVDGRPRERMHLYDPLLLEIGRPPMVRRRSSVLYNFPIDPYLLECESSFSQNYQYVFSLHLFMAYCIYTCTCYFNNCSVPVMQEIVKKNPLFGRELSSKDNSLYELMFMCV
jgi:hypothetical protein